MGWPHLERHRRGEDGQTDDQCCVVHRGTEQTSRLWLQRGDMTTQSVAKSFHVSSIVGTAVHTSRVAAVGNFDNNDYPDIIIGNRLYLNRRSWVIYPRRRIETSGGRATTLLATFEYGKTLDECKTHCLETVHCNAISYGWNINGRCQLFNFFKPPDPERAAPMFFDTFNYDSYILEPAGEGFDYDGASSHDFPGRDIPLRGAANLHVDRIP